MLLWCPFYVLYCISQLVRNNLHSDFGPHIIHQVAIISSELYMHVSCLTVVLVVIYMYMYMLTVHVPLTYLCTVTRYVNYHISKHMHTIPGSIDDINTPAKAIRELQQGWLLSLIQSHYQYHQQHSHYQCQYQ